MKNTGRLQVRIRKDLTEGGLGWKQMEWAGIDRVVAEGTMPVAQK